MVKTLIGLGATGGSPELGETCYKVGRHTVPICEDKGRNLDHSCKGQEQVGVLGRGLRYGALVVRRQGGDVLLIMGRFMAAASGCC